VLGPTLVRAGGRDIVVRGTRLRTLLAVLLVHANQTVPTDRLAEAVWDAGSQAGRRGNLPSYVMRLRRALGPEAGERLVTRARGYALEVDATELDLLQYHELCRQARESAAAHEWGPTHDQLNAALSLWRGEPLADVPAAGTLSRDIDVLLASRRRARQHLIEAGLHLGRHADLLADISALAREHPFDEQLQGQWMLALYRCGRQGDALRAYQAIRRHLADELGIDPTSALQELHQRILNADASLDSPGDARTQTLPTAEPTPGTPAGPRQLPADLTDFTGRAAQVASLEALLTKTTVRGGPVVLCALVGAGGMGKTSLAVHVAHRVCAAFPDGQLQVDLHGAEEPPAEAGEVLGRFLRGLGVRKVDVPAELEERAALYRSTLAGHRVLVLLDNARDAAQVRPLLPGASGCAAIVTSRSILTGLDGAHRLSLSILEPAESMRLLTRIVGDPHADGPEAAAVLKICAGLPLAIRIAAERVASEPGLTMGILAGQLKSERSRLDALEAEDRAVRASFAASYHSLPPLHARAFRLLALNEGPHISLPAAAALLAQPAQQTERILTTLTRLHLLQSTGIGHFTLHDLLRTYAGERAQLEEADGQRMQATLRLLSWYLNTSAAAARMIGPTLRHVALDPPLPDCAPLEFAGFDEALAWSNAEHANMAAAAASAAAAGMHEIAWKLPITMWHQIHSRHQYGDSIGVTNIALASARALGDEAAVAWVLNLLSTANQRSGRLDEAEDCLRQALEIRRRLDDERGQASCLVNLGYVLIESDRAAEAVGVLESALATFRSLSVGGGEHVAHVNLGEAHKALGNLELALAHYNSAYAINRDAADLTLVGRDLVNLADILCLLGRMPQAAEYAARGYTTCAEAGNRLDQAIAADVIGQVQAAAGRSIEALEHWREARDILHDLGHPREAEITARIRQVE